MKLNFSDFLRKCQFPLILALGSMPLHAMILIHNVPDRLFALPFLLLAYVLLAWLCLILPGRVRAAAGALGCAVLLTLGAYLLPLVQSFSAVNSHTVAMSNSVLAFLVPILLCALLIYGLQFAVWPKEREISFNCCAIGVVLHLIGEFAVFIHRNLTPSPYDPVKRWMILCFIAYMPLMLLSLNRISMLNAAQSRQRSPLQMRRRNTVITLCFFATVLLVAAIPTIIKAVERIWDALLRGLWAIISWLVNLMPMEAVSGGGAGAAQNDVFGPMEAAEPSLLARILEVVLTVFAAAAAVLILFFFVRMLLGKLFSLLRTLLARIQVYLSAVSEDYEDEIIDTREEGGQSSSLLGKLRKNLAFVNEKRLSPAERIRYRYRRLLSRHPDWHKSQTARESLPGDPAARYERARYSGQQMTQEEAERFAQEIKNL